MSHLCGGKGEAHAPNQEQLSIINSAKPEIEAKSGERFGEFEVVSVRTQVVAGTNIFAKIKVGHDKYIHVRIWHKLGGAGNEVSQVETGKSAHDAL